MGVGWLAMEGESGWQFSIGVTSHFSKETGPEGGEQPCVIRDFADHNSTGEGVLSPVAGPVCWLPSSSVSDRVC